MRLLVYKYNDEIYDLTLEAGKTYKVGRKDGSDILLEKLPGISREHFEIYFVENQWRVNVISAMKMIEINGDDRKDFVLEGKGEFYLEPYRFRFEGGYATDHDGIISQPAADEISAVDQHAVTTVSPADEESDPNAPDPDDFAGNDDKTLIQSFNGLPYIKIIGQDGKKSEYFRLEGNLWIVGGHEGASVYIKEPSASPNHFEISKTDKGYFVTDLGTKQGTDLNGQRLVGKKPTRLLSGDILSVGGSSLQFELRDKAFKRKVSNIPLNMYKNPLVFFDKDVAMVSLDEEIPQSGSAEEINMPRPVSSEGGRKKLLTIMACVMVLAVGIKQLMPASDSQQKTTQGADPFGQLSPAEQKIVKQTYKLANQLYLDRNYELSLVQLEKLHQIIPVYKKSREIEEYCVNAREVQKQKDMIAQQRREQEMLEAKVNSFISQCESQYEKSDDVDGVKACLVPASDLDPNNPRIAQLVTEVTVRFDEKKVREKMAQEAEEKAQRGRELFNMARALHKKNRYHKAIEAYENHIHSGLPDPRKLVNQSKRHLSSIEKSIRSKKSALMGQAQSKYGGSQLRDAILLGRKAQRVDPYDPQISAFVYQMEKELTNKMKSIYMDSVIEERFGNLEASRAKWEEIIKQDVSDGQYFRKAKRKLRQYGYEL